MSAFTARFDFAPSRLALALIAAGGIIAVAATLIIPMPMPPRIAAALIVAALFISAARTRAALRGRQAVGGLVFRSKREVIVIDTNGMDADLGEIVHCFVSPLLSTITVRGARRHHILLLPDSLPPTDHRHLRIRLNALM